MTLLIILLSIAFIIFIISQIGKINTLADALHTNPEDLSVAKSKRSAILMLIFGVVFLITTFWSAFHYKNYMLGYGPHEAASAHGGELDAVFDLTTLITTIVFVLTTAALFLFVYMYREKKDGRSAFISHNNTLEIVWTAVPAVVLTILVIKGLVAWNNVMLWNIEENEEVIEVGATGWQFAWNLRYPGPDGELGVKHFRLIKPGVNELGQDWRDERNRDDFMADELVLPVDKKVRINISARDVLHSFFLPHFRVKNDAVPGIPTEFVFTPTITTEEYREKLSHYEEYQIPSDPEDPNSPPLWQAFNFELACAELCGTGHYSMRRVVRIVENDEYQEWLDEQKSWYFSTVRNTDNDPYQGDLLPEEIAYRSRLFDKNFKRALSADDELKRILELKHVQFKTGSAELTELSKYELNNVIGALNDNPDISIELMGHTDNTGESEANQILSENRANKVLEFLTSAGISPTRLSATGYGQSQPIADNSTEEGRQKNRRTELKILK